MAWELVEDEPKSKSFKESAVDLGKGIQRNIARTGSNLATRAIGLPGDILSLANSLGNYIDEATGGKSIPYEETFIGKGIPTTETHRKRLGEATAGYLLPQNKVEKFADDIIEDFALMAFPGIGPAAKTSKSLVRPLAISVGSNIAGELTDQLTHDKTASGLVKGGTMFLASLINPRLALSKAGALYEEARSALPKGSNIASTKYNRGLDTIENSITVGRNRSALSKAEQFVLDQVDKARGLIQNGRVNIEQLIAQKKSLYEDLNNLYKEFGEKGVRGVKNQAKRVSGVINESIKDYGQTNPSFYKPFKQADEITGVFHGSQGMQNWVKRNLKNVYTLATVTGLPSLFGVAGLKVAGQASIAAASANEVAKLTYKISKSPELRKLYTNALRSAAKEDAAAFNKYYQELNSKLKEDQDKEKWEFID